MENKHKFAYLASPETEAEWLAKIFSSTSNQSYVSNLLDHEFFKGINDFLRDMPYVEVHQIKVEIDRLTENARSNSIEYISLIKAIYSTYIKENCVGPSVYTLYVEETKAPLIKEGPLPDNELDPMSNKNQVLQDKLLSYFERDSEQIY